MLVFYSGYGRWVVRSSEGILLKTEIDHYDCLFLLTNTDKKIIKYRGEAMVSMMYYCNHDDGPGPYIDISSFKELATENDGIYYFEPHKFNRQTKKYERFEFCVLASDILSSSKQIEEKPLTITERQTMLKLVLGMAIDAYGYDPNSNRNSSTGDKNGISSKLATRGINIDADTIRKYLSEAKELL